MTILLIEDEKAAARRLQKMILKIEPGVKIPEAIDSIEGALQWLVANPAPDLILMDIELADGKSFEIFHHHKIISPVIFCTAFDQYALEAFKHHGAAYLLKPIKQEELEEAVSRTLKTVKQGIDYNRLAEAMSVRKQYQKRILVRLGQRYKSIPTEDIAYIFTESKNVLAMTKAGKDIPLDQSMEQMETLLDPEKFFRINRKIIVNIDAIDNMYAWSRSRIKLELTPENNMEAIVATERAGNFKAWLEGNPKL